jgi:hypothetical protein
MNLVNLNCIWLYMGYSHKNLRVYEYIRVHVIKYIYFYAICIGKYVIYEVMQCYVWSDYGGLMYMEVYI